MHNALVWLARIHLDNPLVWLAIISGFLSGALWLYASRIKVPTNLGSGYGGGIVGLQEMSDGFKNQATWNSYAAITTALAAVLQALAQLFPW
jgi:hypothetical protein